ncbi:MAG: alpha/beta hydrolase [Muribaculaceae bacterium]|nr:alpha/beta hydrolase [Muribaculaceae bacterium]
MKYDSRHTPIDLWQGTPVNGSARLTVFPATGGDGKACILCPGGSYFWLDRVNEGRMVAEWLRSNGITAFLLEYRTAGVPAFMTCFRLRGHAARAMRSMQDVFMALEYVKANADCWGVDRDRVGVLGFSAGGHMALMSAEKNGREVLAGIGIKAACDPAPCFVGAVYPVVSFVDRCVHKRSRRGLMGDFNGHHERLRRELSAELNVSPDMPPLFLVSCDDDRVVDPGNSRILVEAMLSAGARLDYRRYKTGGHGFGANGSLTTAEAAAWMPAFLDFVARV